MGPLRIGVSARLLYPDPARTFLPHKSIQYLEQSVANWIMSGEVLAFMIPEMSLGQCNQQLLADFADSGTQLRKQIGDFAERLAVQPLPEFEVGFLNLCGIEPTSIAGGRDAEARNKT